jgi:serine/threonine protein kinase
MIVGSCRFLSPIGRGSFGEVWKAELHDAGNRTGTLIAAKVSFGSVRDSDTIRAIRPFCHAQFSRHPHLLSMFSCSEQMGRFLVEMELADGDLFSWLEQRKDVACTTYRQDLVRLIKEASLALDYLHMNQLLHGGINPGDLLLLDGHIKIADPEPVASSYVPNEFSAAANLSRNLCMAPERKRGEIHPQSDQYALAATYAWLILRHPLSMLNSDQLCMTEFKSTERDVLFRAFDNNPNQRFSTCLAFATALEEAVC